MLSGLIRFAIHAGQVKHLLFVQEYAGIVSVCRGHCPDCHPHKFYLVCSE